MQVALPPGARTVGEQVGAFARSGGSAMASEPTVTLPVLVTEKVYRIGWPAWSTVVGSAALVIDSDADWLTTTAAADRFEVTVALPGSRPVTVALLAITPLSTSAWVTTYVAEQVVLAPEPSDVCRQTGVSAGPAGATRTSSTTRSWIVTVPALVTVNR